MGASMTIHAAYARQGHRYAYGPRDVLPMQSGHVVEVRTIDANEPWLGQPFTVKASWLQPVGMRYFMGEIPK